MAQETLVHTKSEDVIDKIGDVRSQFREKYQGTIDKGEYDQRDLDRLDNDDAYACSFLTTGRSRGDVPKAIEHVDYVFKYRKESGIWDWTDDMFPQEIWDRNAMYYKGADKKGNKILYLRIKEYNPKTEEEKEGSKKFFAHMLERHHREFPGQRCVIFYDYTGAGAANMSMEMSKYTLRIFNMFPSFLAYAISYELPWILTAMWKAVCLLLPKEASKMLISVRKSDIGLYLPEEHLWPHMKPNSG